MGHLNNVMQAAQLSMQKKAIKKFQDEKKIIEKISDFAFKSAVGAATRGSNNAEVIIFPEDFETSGIKISKEIIEDVCGILNEKDNDAEVSFNHHPSDKYFSICLKW